ncbi:MAG: hypothetical protein CVU84_14540 [Firmicutes bacterium HGW-Firmicutes-1]|jgi:penicillin-binding protein|nr:MAG: hypothetical protein CVU84_14540 [Firmicutes bacterium HGW-Firmicutes-1]
MYHKKMKSKVVRITCIGLSILTLAFVSILIYSFYGSKKTIQPDALLHQYMANINDGKYEEMYTLLSEQSQAIVSQEDFILKNQKIYEGIEGKNLTIKITKIDELGKTQILVSYDTYMDTLAGDISFSNEAYFTKNDNKEYRLLWQPQLIFPMLNPDDKVRVNTLKAERGDILDRNGEVIVGKGIASSIGLVPGKMSDSKELDIARVSELLDIPVDHINKALNATYVKDDTFVPLKKIPKDQQELEEALLEVPGIKISDIAVRVYPFGEKTSHLTGYIQNINAEELKKLKEQNYNANSIIGKSGLEKIFEDRIRAIDGYEIIVVDSSGEKKETLAKMSPKDGETLKLTIDAQIQSVLYDQFREDKSCSVAINPKTGEVLALVSTPTFDSNDFVLGMSTDKWNVLNADTNKPLFNRFKVALCPGSCFKPIIGAIGLTTEVIKPSDNYESSGLSWQKDGSWGEYKVTTLKEYGDQVNLQNALVYSDNIYFAKAALNIGGDLLAEQLTNIGFQETIPFELGMYPSSFSNTGTFDTEIQLADSGYGQAQILINPLHMASIYSAFVNDGNMIKPYLIYKESTVPEYWKEQVFTKEAAQIVRNDLIQVIENGTGSDAKIDSLTLAGKTGTAEIKQSKDDHEGTELGWFSLFTVDEHTENPILVITMVEDVKERGGSHYVIQKVKTVFEKR